MSAPTLFVIAKDLTRDAGRRRASTRRTSAASAGPGGDVPRRCIPARELHRARSSQVRLEPSVVQNVVSYVTVIDVPNPDVKLKPGMTANVDDRDRARRRRAHACRMRHCASSPASAGGARDVGVARPPSVDSARWQLQPVRVETGISERHSDRNRRGASCRRTMPVVTGVGRGEPAPLTRRGLTASPLIPQRPGGNRQGGAATGRSAR